jgi:hypothetical protein
MRACTFQESKAQGSVRSSFAFFCPTSCLTFLVNRKHSLTNQEHLHTSATSKTAGSMLGSNLQVWALVEEAGYSAQVYLPSESQM